MAVLVIPSKVKTGVFATAGFAVRVDRIELARYQADEGQIEMLVRGDVGVITFEATPEEWEHLKGMMLDLPPR
jgi:hypothetical protein